MTPDNQKSILMVPVHLDAIYLKQSRTLIGPMADFSLLPYNNGARDVHFNTANISDEVVSQPFDNETFFLKPGIYLHWSLPDTLTKGVHDDDQMDYPRVPNRWLITRTGKNSTGSEEKKQWIVESDYLYPYPAPGDSEISGSPEGVCIPFRAEEAYKENKPPFRYMGRQVPFESWKEGSGGDYVAKLTALGFDDTEPYSGFAEPTFAAFFPNCHSVFGFYDDNYSGDGINGVKYEVIGWYSDSEQDYLYNFLKEPDKSGLSPQDLFAAIKKELNWEVLLASGQAVPDRMLCYADLIFEPDTRGAANPSASASTATIAVGNTGTEALSAYLATQINKENKEVPEDQLEALQLSAQLIHRHLDLGAKFKEARHTKGFFALPGGIVWRIKRGFSRGEAPEVTLPDNIGELLSGLNALQRSYDRAQDEMEALRRQLYSDWYQYMISAYPVFDEMQENYPDIDEIKYYIEQQDLALLEEKMEASGEVIPQKDALGNITGLTLAPGSSPSSLASRLISSINGVADALAPYSAEKYALYPTAAARYWQANDPVVLLTGESVIPTSRHGCDGVLECQILSAPAEAVPLLYSSIEEKIKEISEETEGSFAFNKWNRHPWNPFLLEWEVEVFPVKNKSNLDSADKQYQPDFITDNYSLSETDVDLKGRRDDETFIRGANIYRGQSILTPQAGIQLKTRLRDFLNSPEPGQSPDMVETAKKAETILETLNILSQSLGGFNEALLMHKQTRQLNIAEPLGFDSYKSFTEKVSQWVGKAGINCPQPFNDFNPIRSGILRIAQLRLIDTFGQVNSLDCSNIVVADTLNFPEDSAAVWLPPRLVQPARLNFRWLSANHTDGTETTSHSNTCPICGWMVPNNLDGSLMFYDSGGQAIGSINQLQQWQQVPGPGTIEVQEIANPYLKRVVQYFLKQGTLSDNNFLADFLVTADKALENIEPENFARHESLALLMGRPIAIIRASLNLEIKGTPAVNVGWNVVRQNLNKGTRQINAFTSVMWPIRIGEYKQLNDGLVGYWKEKDDGFEDNIFYAPQSDQNTGNPFIWSHSAAPLNINQTPCSPVQNITILMDPRGKIHATMGMLPVKEISLPPEQYMKALKHIDVTFLSTPIITGKGSPCMPLPVELGYTWTWIEKKQDAWSQDASILPVNTNAFFPNTRGIREGWLKLSKTKGE